MSIQSDCHLHSNHSGDSDTPMEDMIRQGIALGLHTMCFTEHNDFGFPETDDLPKDTFLLNVDSYLYELLALREKYADQIKLLFGLELGLQPEVFREKAVLARSYEFDFIIASSHLLHGQDPYYPSFFAGKTDESVYRDYFQSELDNIRKFSNFDVYGHLDYIVRYGASKDADYSYDKYKDILDAILTTLLEKEKGLELNTGGIKYGMRDFHPTMDVLKRYRELGGEIITVGSDAHDPAHIAEHFDRACEVLHACGFRYYTIFEKRVPEYKKLSI